MGTLPNLKTSRDYVAERAAPAARLGLLLGLVAVLWEIVRYAGLFDPQLLPGSAAIADALLQQVPTRRFWADVSSTLYRALGGLTLAFVLGVPTGLLIGSTRLLRPLGLPLVDFLRSIPVTTLYPVFVLTLGIGDRGKIGMVFLGCVLIIVLHSAAGFERRSRVRYQVARLYGASRLQLLFRVSVFEALPSVLTGVRVAVGLALIISTLTEMFMGADRGMGQSLMEAYSVYNLPVMYAYIGALGIIGFVLNRVCASFETRANLWSIR